MDYPNTQLYINGTWCAAKSGATAPVFNPTTGDEIGRMACCGIVDLDRALAAAQASRESWKATPAYERAGHLRRAGTLLRERADRIAGIMTAEHGKPVVQSRMEVLASADVLDWFAEEARRTYGQVIPSRQRGVAQLTVKEAVGTVAAFSPWNFPVNQLVRKLAAALAAGCPIIAKAPSETPASPAELVRCLVDAGIPNGVIGFIAGNAAEISNHLIPHPVIKKISFTGSTPVGKTLAGLAGQHMKRVTMELGGHAPVLVFDDADVATAAKIMVATKFRNAGQICTSPTRFMVQMPVADAFTEKMVCGAKALRVGPGTDPDVEMGPLATERGLNAIERLVADAVERGATLLCGGERIGKKGNFFAPTLLADVPPNAALMNEEPFGPIAAINRFSEDDEAFAEANRLPFGLASYAWTTSSARMQRLTDEVQAGMLTVNHVGLALPELPFGGIGDSGIGTEGGSEAIDAYLQSRFVTQKG